MQENKRERGLTIWCVPDILDQLAAADNQLSCWAVKGSLFL